MKFVRVLLLSALLLLPVPQPAEADLLRVCVEALTSWIFGRPPKTSEAPSDWIGTLTINEIRRALQAGNVATERSPAGWAGLTFPDGEKLSLASIQAIAQDFAYAPVAYRFRADLFDLEQTARRQRIPLLANLLGRFKHATWDYGDPEVLLLFDDPSGPSGSVTLFEQFEKVAREIGVPPAVIARAAENAGFSDVPTPARVRGSARIWYHPTQLRYTTDVEEPFRSLLGEPGRADKPSDQINVFMPDFAFARERVARPGDLPEGPSALIKRVAFEAATTPAIRRAMYVLLFESLKKQGIAHVFMEAADPERVRLFGRLFGFTVWREIPSRMLGTEKIWLLHAPLSRVESKLRAPGF